MSNILLNNQAHTFMLNGKRYVNSFGGEGGVPATKAIASNGNQWLTLPYYNDDNPVIEFKFLQPYNVNQSIIIGDMWDLNAFCFYMESDGYNYFRYNNVYENMYQIPQKLWKWVNVKIDYATSKVTVDDIDYTVSSPKTQLHYPICLFGLPSSHMSCIAITDFKVYINDTLDMQLEARKDELTGAGYFYDTIGQQSYYSDSSTPLLYMEDNTPTVGEIPPIGYTIFKDGEFYNQDKMTLNLTSYVIEDGKIKFTGTGTKGVSVNTCSLTTNYLFITKFKCAVDNPYCQAGRSMIGANVPDIVERGVGRITYTNFQSNSNVDESCITTSLNGQSNEGAFLSVGSYENTYISEIMILPCDALVTAN